MSQKKASYLPIPVNKIRISDDLSQKLNVRSASDARKDLDSLKESIRRVGLIHPIIVTRINDEYEVVAGQRRLYAYQELGESTIPALVFPPLDVTEGRLISAHESLIRRRLSLTDRRELAKYLYDKYDGDLKKITKALCVTKTTAASLIPDRLIPEEVVNLVDRRKITRTFARRLVALLYPATELIKDVAKRAVDLTGEEKEGVVDFLRDLERRGVSPPVAKEIIDRGTARKRIKLTMVLTGDLVDEVNTTAKEYDLKPDQLAKVALIEWLEARRG